MLIFLLSYLSLSIIWNFCSLILLPFVICWEHPTRLGGFVGLSIFNPVLWVEWLGFNWFGAIITVLVFTFFWWPYALGYWFYKLFTWHPKKNRK